MELGWGPKFVLHAMRFIAAWIIAGWALLLLCVLVDWFAKRGWGYPWWSAPFLLGGIAIAVLIRRAAAWALARF
jgi:hypothetical protein